MLHLHKEQLHCWVPALAVISVSHQHPACVPTHWPVPVMVYCYGKIKHLTVQYLLPSVQPGLAKGGLTWESCLAHAFWPGSSKALKNALQNSRLSTCSTVLLDQSHGGRGGKLLLSYFSYDWQFGLYPYGNVIYCKSACCIQTCMLHSLS